MMILTIWIIATLTFILMLTIPGSPFSELQERTSSEAAIANMERHYNLDKPTIVQYFLYLKSIATFDFGPSISKPNDTVNDLINRGFPISAEDRKSTRLNSSHVAISYAVFCLQKKKQN